MDTSTAPARTVRIDSYSGTFNLFNPDQKYIVIRVWLPDGAPMECLSAEWKDGKEPDIDNLPPSEVVSLIAKQFAREGNTSEKALSVIGWCRLHCVMIDKLWAQNEVERAKKRIADAQKLIVELTDSYIDIDDEST